MVWSEIYPGWIYPTRFWVTKFSRSDLLRILIITSLLINVNRIARFGWECMCGVLFIYTQGVFNLDPSLLYHLYGETLDLEEVIQEWIHYVILHLVNLHFVNLHFVNLHWVNLTFGQLLHLVNLHFANLHFVNLHFVNLHLVNLTFGQLLHLGNLHFVNFTFR